MDLQKMELHSKSGDLIPVDGQVFPITRRAANGEDEVVEITLRQTLVGLFTQPKPGNTSGRSQAMQFASYAVQKGFTTEEEILARYPDIAVGLNADRVPTSRAWRLVEMWGDEIKNERDVRAAQTQRDNGKTITQGQVNNALLRIEQLREKQGDTKTFSAMIERLGTLVSEFNFDSDDPKGGDMSLAIAGAYKVLGIQRVFTPNASSSSDEDDEGEPF